ncbi:paraquat-inducible protein B [Oxalobacteraceae bacterium GrIS 2.11]
MMTSTELPEIPTAVKKTRGKRKFPLIWIIPILTALIGAWLVVQNIRNEGPTITIRFNNAEGIEPGKTKIRYKDVDIGLVKAVDVSKDRRQVILTAKLVKQADDYLVSDTRFWVVRPHISAGVVSGLSTILSGPYIGVDIGKSQERSTDYAGLEIPPIVTDNTAGREFVLHSTEIGSLDVSAIVTYRRIGVGQVVGYVLDPSGKSVTIKIFVNAPYDQFVTANTKFWHASGLDLSFDANGLKLETQSLGSLIQGGLAFQTPDDLEEGPRAVKDQEFTLFLDRDHAMRLPDLEVRRFAIYFKDSLRGLSVGAPVDFHGITIGEVKTIGVEYLKKEGLFRFPVEINIYPDRMRARTLGEQVPQNMRDNENRLLTEKLVSSGMRAQLKTGNLLTGQLYVSLDFYPEARKETIDWKHKPPVIPSINGGLGELQESVASILKKVDKIPLDQLSGDLQRALKQLTQTLADSDHLIQQVDTDLAPELKATLAEARGTLVKAQNTLNADSPLQSDLRETLKQVSKSARAIADLADYLDRHPDSLIRGKPDNKPLTHGDKVKP